MESNNTVYFFQSLGKLFYAISASDGNVNENEIKIVQELMNTEWEGVQHSEHIERTFKNLVKEKASSSECFNQFVAFKNKNEVVFTPEVKSAIAEVAGAIAASFSNKNKSELILLAKLALEFKK